MRHLALFLAALSLAGCSILEDDVGRGYAQRDTLTAATFTTADIRLVTTRQRHGSPDPIICTEPSPDVAKALSAAAAASVQAAKGGSGSGGAASAEAVLALAGRSTALLGLRDGLYRACEAYANGALGADAYALVLSRYGQLMTTLFLGQDITGSAGTAAGGSVQSPPVTVMAGGTSVTAGQASNASTPAPPPTGTATPSGTDVSAVALTRMNEDYLNLGYNPDALITACINYGDSTRLSTNGARRDNTYLEIICPKLIRLDTLEKLGAAADKLIRAKILAPPVSPEAAMQAAASKAAAANKATTGGGKAGAGGGGAGAGGGNAGAGGGKAGAGGGNAGAGGGNAGAGGGNAGAGGGNAGAGGGNAGAGGGNAGAGGRGAGAGGGNAGTGGSNAGAASGPTPLHTPGQ
jgi:hypothetical protein